MPTAPAPALATDVARRLRLAVARLARRLRQEADGDEVVTATQLAALSTIDRLGPLTLGELAAVEHVQPPTMTRVVGRLEELGYLTREVDAADRRVARAVLTPAGSDFIAETRTRRDAFLAERLDHLTAAERAAIIKALPALERLVAEAAGDQP